MRPRLSHIFNGALFGLLLGMTTAALAAEEADPAWFAREWQSEDGLPENAVTGVVQSREGYLWVATQHALARFDGVRFTRVTLPDLGTMPQPALRALLRGSNAELWIAMENGTVLCLSPQTTNVFTLASGPVLARRVAMAQDAQGAVWIGYADGAVWRIARGRAERLDERHGLPPGESQCWLTTDLDGRIWFAKAGQVGLFRDGRFVSLATFNRDFIRLCAAREGGVWVCAGLELWRLLEGQEPKRIAEITPARRTASPRVILEDRAGAVWIGTSAGLFRFDSGGLVPVATSHSQITDLVEDREANIWAGTDGGGLNRLRSRVVSFVSPATGLPFESARSLCQDTGGTIWLVSQTGMLWRKADGTWSMFPERSAWQGKEAVCVAADHQGGVWIGTSEAGLHYWRDGKMMSWRQSDGLGGDTIRSLLTTTNGDLWIGLEGQTVQRLRQGAFTSFPLPSSSRPVRAMIEDSTGAIWMGTASGHLFRMQGETLVEETARTLPVPWPIRCLSATADGSVWIGYAGGGIGRFKGGRFIQIAADRGLHDEFVSFIAPDEYGSLWIGADRGVFELRQRELESVLEGRLERVRSLVYGRDEGLPSLQATYGYSPTIMRSRDGRLWFPMRTGLAIIDPDPVRASHVPPPVMIERLLLDGRPISLRSASSVSASGEPVEAKSRTLVELPPGHRRLDIEFTGLSFLAPDNVHFRHRLQGLDEDWSEPGRARGVSYARLPAGEYRFEVTACNRAGVWNPTAAAILFRVRPFFWQTWTFRLVAFAAFTTVLVALVRYVSLRGMRRRLLRLEQEAAVHNERARIAKDIHDDLGASLTQIALLGELARHDLSAPDQVGVHINKIAETARHGVKSLEEIVWAVNPRNDTLGHLLDYVGQFAVDFLRSAEIRCRIDFPSEPPARNVSSDVRHNLFLAVKEGLNNLVKHSGATEVWLRAETTAEGLRLGLGDNGRGFTPDPDKAWADGLRNMRQRLAEIGGACEIESRPGAGTKITFNLPWIKTGGNGVNREEESAKI